MNEFKEISPLTIHEEMEGKTPACVKIFPSPPVHGCITDLLDLIYHPTPLTYVYTQMNK